MTNEERISSAMNALLVSGIDPDTPETDTIDLITNLLHLAWEERLLPSDVVRVVLCHFEAEALRAEDDGSELSLGRWQHDVANGDTYQGYHDWVNSQRETKD